MMQTDFYTIEDSKAVHYIRSGECNQCGECCGIKNTIRYSIEVRTGRSMTTAEATATDDWVDDDWSSREGWTLFWAQGLWWYFKIASVDDKPGLCRAQDCDTKLCSKWDDIDGFPAICRYWPFRASDLERFPECGFRFEKAGK